MILSNDKETEVAEIRYSNVKAKEVVENLLLELESYPSKDGNSTEVAQAGEMLMEKACSARAENEVGLKLKESGLEVGTSAGWENATKTFRPASPSSRRN